jgi:thermitase
MGESTATGPDAGNVVPGEIIVKFKKSTSETEVSAATKKTGTQAVDRIKSIKAVCVKVPANRSIHEVIGEYESMGNVEYAEPVHYVHALAVTPNDTFFANQWPLVRMKAPQAWDVTTGDPVTVAVVDTGVDYNHPDLVGKVINGYDFINNDNDAMDDYWHGTHVAGTIATASNNGAGIAGVSWGARILAVKALGSDGSGDDFTVSDGIRYAADHGAKIINLSLGGYGYSVTMAQAVAYAQGKGCIIVAAAGNDDIDDPLYPAACKNVIGVAATDRNDVKASYSNHGWAVDVAAPGGDGDLNVAPEDGVLSCLASCKHDGDYAYAEGPSMATSHVAGLAALIAGKYPGKTTDELTRLIMESVDDLGAAGRDDTYGYGRINAQKAVTTDVTSLEETDTAMSYSGAWASTA